MSYLLHVAVVLALVACPSIASVDLVLAVQRHFHSGCVFLLQSVGSSGLDEKSTLLREFSRRHMQIGILNFNTAEEIRPGKCLNNKVLQVLLTTDEITKRALSEVSQDRGVMSEAFWLLFVDVELDLRIFLEKVLIPVNCVFVVARRGYSETIILKEVYRMDQGLPLQETWFGTWNVRSGLKATPHSLMKRRSNFHGYLITATAMDFPPLVLMKEDENNLTGGLFGVVWKILEKRLNFRTVFKIPDERTWGVYHSNNTTTGMVDMLHSGKVEVAVFNMLMTSRRSLVMDFSIPLLNPAYHIFIRRPDGMHLEWDTYLAPFSRKLWFAVLLLILLISLFLPVLFQIGRRHGLAETTAVVRFRIKDSLFVVFGAFCQQGMEPGCPQQSSCRVVYLTMYLTAVILLAAYSATLISFLTIRSISLPFRNLEEILSIRTHKLGALKDSTMLHHFKQNSSGLQLYAEVYDHLLHERYGSLVRDTKTGLQRVCDEKYLLMAMYTDVVTHLPSLHCRVMTLPSNYFRSSLAFGFRLQSPYKPFINYHLQAMKDDGVLHKLRSHLEAPFKVHQNDLGESVSGWVSVEMEHLLPILTTLAAGIVLGASFLFLECAGRSVLFRHIWRVRFRRSPPFSPYRVLSHAKSQLLNA